MAKTTLDQEAILAMLAAKDVEQLWPVFLKIVKPFGFDGVLYGTNRLSRGDAFGRRPDSFFLTDLPGEIMKLFWDKEQYRDAVIADWAMRNNGVRSLRYGGEIYASGKMTPRQTMVHESLMQAGVTSGIAIGFTVDNTMESAGLGLINLGASHDETEAIWAANEVSLMTYAQLFQLKLSSFALPMPRKKLTKRQMEVLRWVAEGKTNAEVATILGLSSATIEKHLRQSRETLGVSTTLQAVLHAQIYARAFTDPR